jgi:hypothetical protein
MSDLHEAISHLGAREVAPGRYAYKIGNGTWMIATEAQLLHAARRGVEFIGVPGARTPAWWTPEQRVAWRFVVDNGERFTEEYNAALNQKYHPTLRITASLETGEEIPA